MPRHVDESFALRTTPLGEADLLVVLLAREAGKVRGVARSARRSRKRFGGALQPLSRVRAAWTVKPGRDLHRLVQILHEQSIDRGNRRMAQDCQTPTPTTAGPNARKLAQDLAPYRGSNRARSLFELAITIGPFILLWLLMWAFLDLSYWISLLLAVPAAGFLVRVFLIQHDCGHGA